MSPAIRIVVCGASGRMGQALLRLAAEDARLKLIAAVTGRTAKPIAALPVFSVAQMNNLPEFDVLIDFSQPEAFDAVIEYCQHRKVCLVSGTTGINEMQRAQMSELSSQVAVLWASNFSLGVAVLNDLVRRAAAALKQWSVDIVETHHIHKKDAPSGTALTLGESVLRGDGQNPLYTSHREGEVVGDHTVKFSGPSEFIELRHNALDRDIFARGALEAAIRLHGKAPGLYQFSELML
jgi:4-hydroxy-tetrahydrodipicolinate reductase